MKEINKLIIYTDGASKGNPGKAGAGVIFKDKQGKTIGALSWYLPKATNNEAEYMAVLLAAAIIKVLPNGPFEFEFRSDSMLIVQQLKDKWKINETRLKEFFVRIKQMFGWGVPIVKIPREENIEADRMANKAIEDYERELSEKPKSAYTNN